MQEQIITPHAYNIGEPVSLVLRNGTKIDGIVRKPLKRSVKILTDDGNVEFVLYKEVESFCGTPLLSSQYGLLHAKNDLILWPNELLQSDLPTLGSMTDEVLIQIVSFLPTSDMGSLGCASPRIARKKRKRRNKQGEVTTTVAVILDEAARIQVSCHARTLEAGGMELWEWLWDCAKLKWGWVQVLCQLESSDQGRTPWLHGRQVNLSFFMGPWYIRHAQNWVQVDDDRDNALVLGGNEEATAFELLQVGESMRDTTETLLHEKGWCNVERSCSVAVYAIRSCRGESKGKWVTEGAPLGHRTSRVYYYVREQSFEYATHFDLVPQEEQGAGAPFDRTLDQGSFQMIVSKEGRFHESDSTIHSRQISRHSLKDTLPNRCKVQFLGSEAQ